MNYQLVISEKPSVAQSIAKVIGAGNRKKGYFEGNGFLVSWCVGHLVELAQPQAYDEKFEKWKRDDLPIFPFTFDGGWKYQVSPATREQFGLLKELFHRKDVDCVINACDAGREGELIFRLVYEQALCKKPMKRLWISSMEDIAIQEGFMNLKCESEYDSLYSAALCRERADWMVGINATRLFSCLYGQTLPIGRVMTPTLGLVVAREAAISAFTPESFYTLSLFSNGVEFRSDRISRKEEGKELQEKCEAIGKISITKVMEKERQETAPALFDLTTLQREANKKLGYTAQQTLDYAQALYEKKLLTYPRTDSRYLTDDMEQTVRALLPIVEEGYSVCKIKEVEVAPLLNSKKVTDHHAILPTKDIHEHNLEELPKGEQEILKLTALRLLEAVSAPCRWKEQLVEGVCVGYCFKMKGKQMLDPGWKSIHKGLTRELECEEKADFSFVDFKEGAEVLIQKCKLKEGKTTPPKSFTEDTLLRAMEMAGEEETPDEAVRKGLGTSATRAGVLEKLVRIGMIERRGDQKAKYLIPTHKGTALITVMPEMVKSPYMTAEWEQKLLAIEKNAYAADIFIEEIGNMLRKLIMTYEMVKDAELLAKPVKEVIGKCPCCGSDVIEYSKAFCCKNRNCKFSLWKNNRFFTSINKQMNGNIAKQLLQNGKTSLKKCKSLKTGKIFDCVVTMSVNPDEQVQFGFENNGK